MAVKTALHPWTQTRKWYEVKSVTPLFKRSGLCILPLFWPHMTVIGCTLLVSLLVCCAVTYIILSDYKCPRCGMQLDYNCPLDHPQNCTLCGKVVTHGQ